MSWMLQLPSLVLNEWILGRKEHSPIANVLWQPPAQTVTALPEYGIHKLHWEEDFQVLSQPGRRLITAHYRHVTPPPSTLRLRPRVLMFFHGNACNILQLGSLLVALQRALNDRASGREMWHVVAVEYDGYTADTWGAPIHADAIAAKAHRVVEHICAQLGIVGERRQADSVVFFGQSIGTAIATLTIATYYNTLSSPESHDIPKAVLLSPFTSFVDLATHHAGWIGLTVHERFSTLLHWKQHITDWKLLLLHGSSDTLVPTSHSHALHEAANAQNSANIYILDGTGHNIQNWTVVIEQLCEHIYC